VDEVQLRPKIERLEDWTYKVEGHPNPLPSVTNIIKATVPKELAWWGMTVGCDGVATLLQSGEIGPHRLTTWTGKELTAKLTENKLTVNHTLTKAGARGSAIHDMLDNYGKTGNLPDDVDEAYAGYAAALVKWLMANRPEFKQQETMTASLEYEYAGTFDAKCVFHDGKYKGKYALVDLKTSKQIYKDQYFPQIEAYEQAEVELGESPTDLRLVVQLGSDGKVKMGASTDTFQDFKVLLDHYHSIQRRKYKRM